MDPSKVLWQPRSRDRAEGETKPWADLRPLARVKSREIGQRRQRSGSVRHVTGVYSLKPIHGTSACLSAALVDFAAEGRLPDRNGLVCSSALALQFVHPVTGLSVPFRVAI